MIETVISGDKMINKPFTIEDMPNEIMGDIYRYWQDMKGARHMPSRADLHPADIARLLPYLTLVDVEHDTKRYKFRLIGTETVAALGKDVTGSYLDQLPDIERYLKARYDWLVKEKKPYFIFDKLKWSGKSFLDYYVLGLPLSQDGQTVDMFLFGTYYMFPGDQRTEFYIPD